MRRRGLFFTPTLQREHGAGRSNTQFVALSALAFLSALMLASIPAFIGAQKLLVPGVILCLVAILGFFRQGGPVISPSSIACYGTLLFCGFPAIYIGAGFYPAERLPAISALSAAITLSFVWLILILSICPRMSYSAFTGFQLAADDSSSSPRGWFVAALATFTIVPIASLANLAVITSTAGFTAIVFAAIGAFGFSKARLTIWGYALVGTLLVGYFVFAFDGFGRLTLGVIAMAVGTLASLRIRRLWLKGMILLVTGPTLVLMAAHRVDYLAELRGEASVAFGGIGSVVGPLASAGAIIEASWQGQIAPTMGATVVAALLVWVPRSVWTDKPVGFGAEIVSITKPSLTGSTEFSDAASIIGEAVWNFGLLFAVVFLVPLVVLVRVLDSLLLRNSTRPESRVNRLERALIVIAGASILNLVWGGLFTLTARSALLFAIFFILLVHARLAEKPFSYSGARLPVGGGGSRRFAGSARRVALRR